MEKSAVMMKESQRIRSQPTFAPGCIHFERARRMQRFVRHQMKERENCGVLALDWGWSEVGERGGAYGDQVPGDCPAVFVVVIVVTAAEAIAWASQ